ncbi:MAG: hypothetical protein WBB00_04965 [Mycobacterium sp.]
MIGVVLLIAAGASYLLAGYWREQTVDSEGVRSPDRRTSLLMLSTVCLTIAAVLVSAVEMVVLVVPS